jgi:hypothetical protein
MGHISASLSWSVHHNFIRDGRYSEGGWACAPHPHQAGMIFPSCWNVRQKVAFATLVYSMYLTIELGSYFS